MVGVLVVGLAARVAGGAGRAPGDTRRPPRRARGLLADRRAGTVAVRFRVRPGESLPLPRSRVHRARPRRRGGRAAKRWSFLWPALIVLLLVPVPANIHEFKNDSVFNGRYFDEEQRILTTVVRMPFARQVPSDVRPHPRHLPLEDADIGFLLDAKAVGPAAPVDEAAATAATSTR